MFGRLPWLAFERRMRALRFLVFFDIGDEASGEMPQRHRGQIGWVSPGASERVRPGTAHPMNWSWHRDSSCRLRCPERLLASNMPRD